jgi:signal transduction histidine kinase
VPLWAWDLGLAVGIAVVGLLPSGHPRAWAYPAAFCAGLALLARRLWPRLVLLATVPALLGGLGTIAAGAALYALARASPRPQSVAPWLVLAMIATIAPVVYDDLHGSPVPATWGDWVVTVLVAILVTGGPVAAGALAATRVQLTASLAALRDTEADRDAAVAARVRAEERNRIAREVHDIVGHYAALIAVQAGALETRAPDPHTRGTAARLRELSSDALEEMRGAVAIWRAPAEAGVPGGARVPRDWVRWVLQPATIAREAGVPITIELDVDDVNGRGGCGVDGAGVVGAGDTRPTHGEDVLRALRRAVQESVTNAVRHCPAAPITLSLRRPAGGLALEVRNPLSAPPGAAGGSGLVGLRERVRQLGGALDAGPVAGTAGATEWRVRVCFTRP